MDSTATVLVVSNSNTKPASIVKLITKQQVQPANLSSASTSASTITEQPWKIETKYYCATINLLAYNDSVEKFDTDAHIGRNIEGIIIHMDANKDEEQGLDELYQWTDLLDSMGMVPEIKLLLANYCNENTNISKDSANLWCMEKGFEFIELFPSAVVQETDPQPFGAEKVGVERVIEALQNNVWSNMSLLPKEKDDKVGDAEKETDEFLELFSNLMAMKSGITSLPTNVRKQCAEEMVTAFWKAIGGDEDELAE